MFPKHLIRGTVDAQDEEAKACDNDSIKKGLKPVPTECVPINVYEAWMRSVITSYGQNQTTR